MGYTSDLLLEAITHSKTSHKSVRNSILTEQRHSGEDLYELLGEHIDSNPRLVLNAFLEEVDWDEADLENVITYIEDNLIGDKTLQQCNDGDVFIAVSDIEYSDLDEDFSDDEEERREMIDFYTSCNLKQISDSAFVIPKGARVTLEKVHGPGGGWPLLSIDGGEKFDFASEESLPEIGLKPL